MKVLIFGATGMVGSGVLRECVLAPDVALVHVVGRTCPLLTAPKIKFHRVEDMGNLAQRTSDLGAVDACFFCLGVTSSGLTEQQYSQITYDWTLSAAKAVSKCNPESVFVYVSGDGADATEQSKVMWARVRGQTENALKRLPFAAVYLFRPGLIQPMNGDKSKTRSYRLFYGAIGWLLPLLRRLAPNHVLSTEVIGRAMLNAARLGQGVHVLASPGIHKLANWQADGLASTQRR